MNDSYKKEEVSTKGTFDGQKEDEGIKRKPDHVVNSDQELQDLFMVKGVEPNDMILFNEMNEPPEFYDRRAFMKHNKLSRLDRLRIWLRKSWTDKVSDVCLKILDAEISTLIYLGMICGISGLFFIMIFSFNSAAITLEDVADANIWAAFRLMHSISMIGWIVMSLVFGYWSGEFEERFIDILNGRSRK